MHILTVLLQSCLLQIMKPIWHNIVSLVVECFICVAICVIIIECNAICWLKVMKAFNCSYINIHDKLCALSTNLINYKCFFNFIIAFELKMSNDPDLSPSGNKFPGVERISTEMEFSLQWFPHFGGTA